MKKSIFATLVALFIGVVLCSQTTPSISQITHERDSTWRAHNLGRRIKHLQTTDRLLQCYADSIAKVKSIYAHGVPEYGGDSLLREKMLILQQLCAFAYTREYMLLQPLSDSLPVRSPSLSVKQYFGGKNSFSQKDTIVVSEDVFLKWHATHTLNRLVRSSEVLLEVETLQSFYVLFNDLCSKDTIDWRIVAHTLDSFPEATGLHAPQMILSFLCDPISIESSASRDLLKDVARLVKIQDTFPVVQAAQKHVDDFFADPGMREYLYSHGSILVFMIKPESKKEKATTLTVVQLPKKDIYRQLPITTTRL